MKELLDRLTAEFADREYAHAYMESHLVSRLAAQVHAIRKQRGLSQDQLSELSGVAQESISKIESANFYSLTLKTLHKFSRAFDVHLHVSFIPFSKGILDTSNLTPNRLRVSPRNEDLASCKDRTFRINYNGEWHSALPIESTVTIARDATAETQEWKLNESRLVTHE